jgi:fructuronate reductase
MSTPGVVHLGLGAFHRAHQALVFEALHDQHGHAWAVLAVSMRDPTLAKQLAVQQFKYHVRIGDASGTHWRSCHGIVQTAVAAQEADRVVQAIAAAPTRWVTLTVTEKGYTPELAGLLVEGLQLRWQAKRSGLTIASCDNLSHNGDRLRALCQQAAEGQPALWDWVDAHCTFPNSMVDRIVPATTPALIDACAQATGVADSVAVAAESFWEWVLEDRLAEPADADLLRSAGVQVVPDVAPYELAKLNLLNGSHSALACVGALLGIETVDQVVADPALRAWIEALMLQDLGPGLARQDWPSYAQALLRRFANPTLGHRNHQICSDLSQKIPQRWQAPALRARGAGRVPEQLALSAALAMRYWQGVSESGQTYAMNDPQGQELHRLAQQHAGSAQGCVQALGRLTQLWGKQLIDDQPWLDAVQHALRSLQTLGVRQTLISATAQA